MPVHYFSEETDFTPSTSYQPEWISRIIEGEGFLLGDLNYIFCTDTYLLEINKSSLNHDYFTDIITFDNSDSRETIAGDLFISVDRVKDNANSLGLGFQEELDRVMIHGVLHLCGYSDNSENEKREIRKKEDVCLSLRFI